jgi:hypothetical protein
MINKFPLDVDPARAVWPKSDRTCGQCGGAITETLVFANGGITVKDDYPQTSGELFATIGTHSRASNITGDAYVEVLLLKNAIQIDLSFCSTLCLRDFFNGIVDRLDEISSQSRLDP